MAIISNNMSLYHIKSIISIMAIISIIHMSYSGFPKLLYINYINYDILYQLYQLCPLDLQIENDWWREEYIPCKRGFQYCNLGPAVSIVLMWLADLGSRSKGGSNHSIENHQRIILVPVTIIRIIRLIQIITNIFSGYCPPSDIGAARIGQSQGPFCTVQLFGAGSHQVQGCAAGLLQSISGENVLRKSSNGPRHNSATRHR